MAEILEFVMRHGRQAAVTQFPEQRNIVEVAAAFAADEEQGLSFLYSGWCQAALPHRRLRDDRSPWEVGGDHLSLVVEPMQKKAVDGSWYHPGIPFGSRARLVLHYIQTTALATRSSEVFLGRSLNQWLDKMGVPACKNNYELVREQVERLAYSHVTFTVHAAKGSELRLHKPILTASMLDAGFADTLYLSNEYWDALRDSPVPLQAAAVRALSSKSRALDLYAWLAYRLHTIAPNAEVLVPWARLRQQFAGRVDGRSVYSRPRDFNDDFAGSLRLAQEVYPDARVEVVEDGVKLYHSKPPVAPRTTVQALHVNEQQVNRV